MIIRPATSGDTVRLVDMARAFHAAPPPPYSSLLGAFDARVILVLIETLKLEGVVLVADDGERLVGMLALELLPLWWRPAMMVRELAWWVEPAARHGSVGPRLLTAAEDWARRKSMRLIQMVAPAGTTVGAFLERRGYVAVESNAVETLYRKALTDERPAADRTSSASSG